MFQPDRTDIKILKALQKSAVISNAELAETVSLSPTPCSRRVKLLEKAGFIRDRVTLLDPERVGLPINAFLQVTLSRHKKLFLQTFEDETSEWPEIMECYLITGDFDYLLRVVVPDLDAYRMFLEKLSNLEGISHIKSGFSLKQVQNRTDLPLDQLIVG